VLSLDATSGCARFPCLVQGIFVLDLPFALVHSGYVGLLLLVVSAWVCNYTGRVLVSCLYEDGHWVRHSYQDIAEACCRDLCPRCPALGGAMVNVAQLIELSMTCTLYLVVSTSLLFDSLSGLAVPRLGCSLLALMFLMPCLLLTDLRPVSTLSLLYNLITHLDLPPVTRGQYAGQAPVQHYAGWTHGAACVLKTLFALLVSCVLTWGRDTSEVITDSLTPLLRPLVNTCLLAKALLSFPLPFYSAAEILQAWILRDVASISKPDCTLPRPALLLRATLLVSCLLLALLLPRFSLLMGLTGSVTGAAMTLVLPCVFHLRLQWDRLSARDRLTDGCILGLGVLCSASGVFCSVKRLLQGL
uniref:Vesicular inhibitory amino acid transporter n=1 Tax=Neogobius melanostomus TaxID=47308 RepID=A0A8C6UFB4_9GOBI